MNADTFKYHLEEKLIQNNLTAALFNMRKERKEKKDNNKTQIKSYLLSSKQFK